MVHPIVNLQFAYYPHKEGGMVYAYEVRRPDIGGSVTRKEVDYADFEDVSWSLDKKLAHYERLMLKYGRLMDELQVKMKTEAG